MSKIWLIIKREFVTRVRSKAFLLGTFLAPLAMVAFLAVVAFVMSRQSDEQRNIAVFDKGDILSGAIESTNNITLDISNRSFAELLEDYEEGKIDGIIEIPGTINENERKFEVNYHSDEQLAIDESLIIGNRVEDRIRDYKVKALDLDLSKVEKLSTNVSLAPKTIKDTDKKISSLTNIVSSVIGGIIGYAMFMIILIYGGQVMRSVMEEKVNRIIEVLISSVKPYQLMMGKIIGVGSVGLLQIVIWMILLALLAPLSSMFIGAESSSSLTDIAGVSPEDMQAAMSEGQEKMVQIMQELGNINWGLLIPMSILYFLGGYFAYASLFAALGSAVGEDINEAQTLMFPIMMPLMLAVYIAFSAIKAPNTSLVVWSSIIPLLSSVVMPVRIPASPPIWQMVLSVVLLIAFCFFFVWLAGRIYRVGILMYGKKASFKELAKWVFFKG